MKTYKLASWVLSAFMTIALAISCQREFGQDIEAEEPLLISPALLELSTRADGDVLTEDDLKDDKYNENKVDRLDVFFFKSDNTFLKAYHITTEGGIVSHGGKEGYLLSNNWKGDGFVENSAYTVYVVANSTNETINSADNITVDALQALTLTDPDIYKRYHASIDNDTYTTTKAFLMNAKVASWSITSSGTQLVNDAVVSLNRAAVKFVVDVSLSPAFLERLSAKGDHYGAPSWKQVNFNTITAEVPGGTAPEAVLATGSSGAYLAVEQGTGEQQGHYSIVTYAYPHKWTFETAPDKAPAVFLSFPSYHGESSNAAYHYYYIPLCESGIRETVSNNLYKVNAVISSFGSSEVITTDEVELNYEVMEWGTSYSADIDAQLVDYLVVTPTTYTFKGGTSTEFLSTTLKYYASSSVSIKEGSVDAYYIDKNGTKQSVSSSQYEINVNANGTIVIKSKIPTNGTYQEVDFVVTCGEGDDAIERTIKFRHYPLDFITAEEGAYSTYDETSWVRMGSSGTYNRSAVYDSHFRYRNYSNNNAGTEIFRAKVFSGGIVHYLNTNGTVGDQVNSTPLTNNRMYVLQLTSSNDSYTLGRPTLVAHTVTNNNDPRSITYYTSADDVISPAFMLGSQLGAVNQVSSSEYAAMHCAKYLEYSDGKEYKGWRLPTKQELQYMMDHQNGAAMIEVLTGEYYWTLDGTYGRYSGGSGGDANGSKYVRCVRDLDQEDLARINKFE
ncbi:MAG: hypothetical protein K6F06_00330 [Bacteroidales bacterium]|nr:hypothetical protein [Bacteroidales bacterium]